MHFLYAIIYLAFAVIDIAIAAQAFLHRNDLGKTLGGCMLGAGVLAIFYVTSILVPVESIAVTANLLCLIIVNIMLCCLICFFFVVVHGRILGSKYCKIAAKVATALIALDILNIILNPIFGHVATYTFAGQDIIPHFYFAPHIGYILHITLCYGMILYGLVFLFYHSIAMPKIYRGPILRVLICTLAVMVFNAIYVVFFASTEADFTILSYSVLGYLIYVNIFVYGNRDALETTSKSVLDASARPTVIFNYQDELFMANKAAYELFSDFLYSKRTFTYSEFIDHLNVAHIHETEDNRTRFYWTPNNNSGMSYICDNQILLDEKGRQVAKYLIFTNNTLSVDQLTGFLTDQYFDLHQDEIAEFDDPPVMVSVCDLNQLSLLNNLLGFSRGDDAISLQAELMREYLPANSMFLRLRDAKLGAITFGTDAETIKNELRKVNKKLGERTDFNIRLKMDFSVVENKKESETLGESVDRAISVLDTRKLLDVDSRHSNAIESLTQMLAECDGETEGHVRRTRILGDGLAYELGLSDYERDQLSLLCLFHDIGKVGIPSEILQKPGKLTPQELTIMQEHVQKGYRIARATSGLEIIAEPILHHHERWDGTGYPDQLKHEAIPILSRIIAVVDAYDAMTSDRPYHKGMAPSDACKELLRCSAAQFDPYVVDAFVRMIETDKNITEETSKIQETEDGEIKEAPQKQDAKNLIPPKADMVTPVTFSSYILNSQSHIIKVDDMFEKLTGYTSYDIADGSFSQNDLIFEDDREYYWKTVQELQKTSNVVYLEHRIRCKNGTGRYVYCTGIRSRRNGEPVFVIIMTEIANSISVKNQLNLSRNRAMMSLRRLEETIQLDPLTNLLNQAAFRKRCEREILNRKQRCVLVMMDIDDFKNFNDTQGHPMGDELLTSVAQALTVAAGEKGVVGRVGGDEFACMLRFNANSSIADIQNGLRDFWREIKRQRAILKIDPSFSAGATLATQQTIDYSELYARADENLYEAKRAGKNRLRFK